MEWSRAQVSRRSLIAGAGAAVMVASPVLAAPIERVPLWPGSPPGGDGLTVRDEWVYRSAERRPDDIAWPHVATPLINLVRPPRPNGAAILYIPGGGYSRVALGRNGSAIARALTARGYTVFELLYRLPHDGWAAGADVGLQDAQRAMRLIRAGAARWRIDPARVAVIGSSAGGHLAARLAGRSALKTYDPVDTADTLSARPIVAGLLYPVITMTGPETHAGSRRLLLGADAGPDRLATYSVERDIPGDMPPTLLFHAADDPVVSPANSLTMFAALQAARIPSELHIFETGGHDLPPDGPDGAHPWPALFERFARNHGL